MNLFKSIFSISINNEHRHRLASAIHLTENPFLFCETVFGNLVRALEVKRNGFNVLLEPQKLEDVSTFAKTHQLPWVNLHHSEINSPEAQQASSTLWKALLPFPWGAMDVEATSSGKTLQYSDPGFQQDWDQIKTAFVSLEKEIKKSEIGTLVLNEGSAPITLIFHHVRGRLMNSGVLLEALSAEALKKRLGTSVTQLEISGDKSSNLLGLKATRETIQKACETAITLSPLSPSAEPPIHFEL